MPKYIERYEDTKRPIRFKDKVRIINGIHKGKIGYVGAKDPDGLPAYNVWFEDGTFDCFMSDEFINAEENVVDLQIIAENNTGYNDILVRYEDLRENCIIERWHRFYITQFGRYIKIKGKRYYIDGKYRYHINQKGDDFDFSNFIVKYYSSEYSQLILKPIKSIRLIDFKRVLEKNGILMRYEEIFNRIGLWEDKIDEIYYKDYGYVDINIPCYEIIDGIKSTPKDKEIFETLKEMYLSERC